MAETEGPTVDAYIAAQPPAARPALKEVRRTLRNALPGAVERISYQIPSYFLPGGAALYFAAWKGHYAIYPASDALLSAFEDELARIAPPYGVRARTIRFPFAGPVPVRLIARLAKFRAKEITELARLKALRKVGAKKAPAKRAPAKKAPAKTAPAKGGPAKGGPAKKAPRPKTARAAETPKASATKRPR